MYGDLTLTVLRNGLLYPYLRLFLVLFSTQVTYHAGPGAQYNYTQDTGEATMDVEIMVRPQLCVSYPCAGTLLVL